MNKLLSNRMKQAPIIGSLLKSRYLNRFRTATGQNLFWGRFADYEEALRNAPKTKPQGYNNSLSAQMYLDRTNTIFYTDYPMLFWMSEILRQKPLGPLRVFDYGGHIGVSYYSYSKCLPFPNDLNWTVYDVPAVRAQGQAYAHSQGATRLSFTDKPAPSFETDVLFVSGSPQYAPDFFGDMDLSCKPKWILVNMIPCNESSEWFTINNIGTAFCPYRIFHKASFEKFFLDAGYQLMGSWVNEGKTCDLSYTTQESVAYFGWCFAYPSPNELRY